MVLSLPEVSPEGAGDRMTAAQVQKMDQFCLVFFPHNYNSAWTRVSAIYKCQMNEVRKSPRAMERSFHLLDSLRCTVPHDLVCVQEKSFLLREGGLQWGGAMEAVCQSLSMISISISFPVDRSQKSVSGRF